MRRPWHTYLYLKSPIVKIGIGIVAVLVAIVVLLFQAWIEPTRMAAQTANWEGRSIEKGAEIFTNNCTTCHGSDGQGGAGPALNSKYFFTQRLKDVAYAGTLEDYVESTVASGRPSKAASQWSVMMPTWSNRFGGPMRDDQVLNVTHYVLNWEEGALAQTAEEDPWIPFQDAPSKAEPGSEEATVGAVPTATVASGPRPPQELFALSGMGCEACHKLDQPQTADTQGQPGPNMGNLYETAGDRVPGQDAATYVHNSIVTPGGYVVPGYLPILMPANFAERMSEEEIQGLVKWILDPGRSR